MIDAGIFSTFIFMKKNFVLFGVLSAMASFYGCGGDSKSSAPEELVVDPVADRCYEKYGFEENAEWSKMISGDSYLEKIVCDRVSERMSYMLSFYARCTKAKYDKSKKRFEINVLTERGDNQLWADVTGCKYKLGVDDNYQFNGFVANSPEFDFGECFCKTEGEKTYYRNINPELLKEESSSSAESSSSDSKISSSSKDEKGSSSSAAKSSSSVEKVAPTDSGFVNVGGQIWTTRNLDVAVDGSMCYDDKSANCDKYGRMYTWAQVMQVDESYNKKELGKIKLPYQGICPEGTHLPSYAEWDWLFSYLEKNPDYNKYFNQQSGGAYDYKGYYRSEGYEALFWSSTEYQVTALYEYEFAWLWSFRKDESRGRDNGHKITGAYVRCLRDDSKKVELSSSSAQSSSSVQSSSSSEPVYSSMNEVYDPELTSIQLGDQKWMTRNLNVEVEGSRCYDDVPENCEKHGRLYTWAQAMNIDTKYDKEKLGDIDLPYQGICPEGTHLPSFEEWKKLKEYFNSHPEYTVYFMNQIGGYYHYEGRYKNGDYESLYWSSTEYDVSGTGYGYEFAYLWAYHVDDTDGYDNAHKYAAVNVRCIYND